MLTLLLGGARSGKSALALQMAQATGVAVMFVATAEGRDEEMTARIDAHRAERPHSWSTVEAPVHVAPRPALGRGGRPAPPPPDGATVVIDCLTLWVANAMEAGLTDGAIIGSAGAIAAQAAGRAGSVIVISNEVGAGIVPADPVSRRYRDVLGRVNTVLAEHADDAFLVVAGRVLALLRPAAGASLGST
jgi:adenosyl cobinamide kinase/adenosyl cobinamide phosphate guanylyltransferase